MKKILFSLCILLCCLCFVRVVLGNDSTISSEMMIDYISNNFESAETINEMMVSFESFIEKTDKIMQVDQVQGIIDFIGEYGIPGGGGFGGMITGVIAFFLESIFMWVYYLCFGVVFLVNLVINAIPILMAIMKDTYSVLKLVMYVLFGASL